MAKRILITGGAGFVGSHLADALLHAGHEVRVFDNLTEQVHQGGPPPYLSREVELISDGMEIVFHLAAAVGVGQSMYAIAHYMGANTQGTANLLQAILDSKARAEK